MPSDLRHAIRELRKRPALTLTAVLSLALGIGATTAVFSVIYAVLISPYPYRDANRLTTIQLFDPQGNLHPMGYSGPEIAQPANSNLSKVSSLWSRRIQPPPTATSPKTFAASTSRPTIPIISASRRCSAAGSFPPTLRRGKSPRPSPFSAINFGSAIFLLILT